MLDELGMRLLSEPCIRKFEAGAHILALSFNLLPSHLQIDYFKGLTSKLKAKAESFKCLMSRPERTGLEEGMAHGLVTSLAFCLEHLRAVDGEEWRPPVAELGREMVALLQVGVDISSENVSLSVFERKEDHEAAFKKGMEQIFKSNSLLTSLDEPHEEAENLFVVSFYLLTKQAGLLFTELGKGLERGLVLPPELVDGMVRVLFEGLQRIKHLGSINRLA